MKTIVKIIYGIFTLLFISYLLLPVSSFPPSIVNSLQSNEPADIEDEQRKSYFTNLDREGVVGHYKTNFMLNYYNMFRLYPLRLNYPPEEAQLIIRDQTRSTFLEELVFPFRESLYINGFKPSVAKDAIIINEKQWEQKITIKYVSSSIFSRLIIGIAVITIIPVLTYLYIQTYKDMKQVFSKNK